MPKYDAFGRKIGENTLEGLGGDSRVPDSEWTAGQLAEARAAEAPPAEEPPRPTFTQPPTTTISLAPGARRGLGCAGVIVVLAVLLAIGGAILAAVVTVEVGDEQAVVEPESAPPGATAENAPRGLERASLVRRDNFARALRRLRAARLGKLRSIRVAPERIDVQILTPGGRLLSAQLRHDGELRRFGASGAGFGFVDTVPYGRVNTAAPERLTRAGAKRLGRSTRSIDYLAYVAGTGEIAWGAFFKGGGHVQGNAAGRFLRRVS